jgi:hypothetical protein
MTRQRIVNALRRAYLEMDPRSLGMGRIGIGLLLMFDLIRRTFWLRDFYSNDGLLPNHTLLWRPPADRMFSLLWPVSWPGEVVVAFLICFLVYACLLVGYRTRVAHVLAFLVCVSLHNRVQFVENGGAVAMKCVVLWTMFMPLGQRYSVDAVLARLRARRSDGPPGEAAPAAPDTRPFVSLAMLGLLLQLSVIYYFNYIHKTGPTWRDGTAVHYVLWQERIVTTLGVWVRHNVPFVFTKALSWGTLIIEAAAPLLLLIPVGWRYTRPLAIAGLASLHIGIALMSNLGAFSYAMLSFYPFLLAREHQDWLGRRRLAGWLAARGRRIEALLARLQATWATPGRERPPSPFVRRWRGRRPLVRELLVAFVMVVIGMEVLVANSAVPRALKPRRPEWMVAFQKYTHIYEGWSMFSPDAPLGDMMVYVDAVTIDGRRVDPLNEVGSRVAALPVTRLPVRLDHDSFFCDYTLRIPDSGSYHQALIEWIMKYPKRTGNPRDQIVSFEAHVIEHRSPAPGSFTPHDVRDRVFLRHYQQP